jgi:glycerol-3-phosphate acyltransferase PlsX
MRRLPVAIDAMGGDDAPRAMVAGAVLAARGGLPTILVGDEAVIRPELPSDVAIEVVHAGEVVAMDDRPGEAKKRPESSIRRAVRLVNEGRACGVVGCGNSGATLFAAVLELGKIEGVDRPAIATSLPRVDGGTLYMIDVGTTTDAQPHHLASFALLGDAYARTMGVAEPRVALLSNGHEPGKGNRLVVEAHPLLAALPIRFVGNIEPDAAFAGGCDVLVTDGFTGNILLKTAEGVIGMLKAFVTAKVGASRRAQVGAMFLGPVLRALRDELDWRARGGALLVGVPAPVVIGHGRSDAEAVRAAVRLAHYASEGGLTDAVGAALADKGRDRTAP